MDTRDLQLAQSWEPSQAKQSTPAGTGLSPLAPSALLPETYSRHMQRIAGLKQIREIRVSGRNSDGKHYYVVGIQTPTRFRTNIPTMHPLATAAECELATIAEKTLDEFAKLRDDLYSCSKTSHLVKRCAFCSEVARNLRVGILLPGSLFVSTLPKEKRSRVLRDFLKTILQLAISCPIDVRQTCRCQEQVPRQVYTFLYGPPDGSRDNISRSL